MKGDVLRGERTVWGFGKTERRRERELLFRGGLGYKGTSEEKYQ